MASVPPPLCFAAALIVTLGVLAPLGAFAEVPIGFGLGVKAGVVTLNTGSWPFADVDPGFGLDGFIRYAPSTKFV